MKINSDWRPFGKVKIGDSTTPLLTQQKSFSDIMQQQDGRRSDEQLNKMLQQIHQQSERLLKSMTIRELRAYKLLVKRFLEETVRRGVGIKEIKGWDRRGRSKRYKLLDEIDSKLLDMADELLESEAGQITLLNNIGEIKGMLINLLF